MEELMRSALLEWLRSDSNLSASLNAICEEAPARASLPWLAVATSASIDWSCKNQPGREVRIALELHARAAAPDATASLVSAIEARIASLPRDHSGFSLVSQRFLRARSEQRGESRRAILIEYAFRLLAS